MLAFLAPNPVTSPSLPPAIAKLFQTCLSLLHVRISTWLMSGGGKGGGWRVVLFLCGGYWLTSILLVLFLFWKWPRRCSSANMGTISISISFPTCWSVNWGLYGEGIWIGSLPGWSHVEIILSFTCLQWSLSWSTFLSDFSHSRNSCSMAIDTFFKTCRFGAVGRAFRPILALRYPRLPCLVHAS